MATVVTGVGPGAAVNYHLFLISADGELRQRVELDCRDDAHAIAAIEDSISDQAMELWQGERLVKRFEASDRG